MPKKFFEIPQIQTYSKPPPKARCIFLPGNLSLNLIFLSVFWIFPSVFWRRLRRLSFFQRFFSASFKNRSASFPLKPGICQKNAPWSVPQVGIVSIKNQIIFAKIKVILSSVNNTDTTMTYKLLLLESMNTLFNRVYNRPVVIY